MQFTSVYLMLGQKCNFSCKYCMQHDQFTAPCPSNVNYKLLDYINNIEVREHFSKKNDIRKKAMVQLWGGEPLLYWETIKDTVQYLDHDKFEFTIITNGALLTQDKIDFINEHNVCLVLSNDGECSDYTRGRNMLEDEKFLNLYKQVKNGNRAISLVVSPYNSKLLENVDYFRKMIGEEHLTFLNFDFVKDLGSLSDELKDFDLVAFDNYLAKMFASLDLKIKNQEVLDTYTYSFLDNSLRKTNYFYSDSFKLGKTKCGTVESMLNIDMDGNVYVCHNAGMVLGNIFTDDYADLLKQFNDKYNIYTTSKECLECIAYPACLGGCVLMGEKPRKEYSCELTRIYYKRLIEFATAYNT